MTVTIEPTEKMHTALLHGGVDVPLRVWQGSTEAGQSVELFVFAIVPMEKTDKAMVRLAKQLPAFMVPTRDAYRLAE